MKKMKIHLIAICTVNSLIAMGQVGINTTTPSATFEIQSTTSDGVNKSFEVKDSNSNTLLSVYKNKMISINNPDPYAGSIFDSSNYKILMDIEGSMLTRGHFYNFVSLNKINHPVFFGSAYRGTDIRNPQFVLQGDVLNSFVSRDLKSNLESIGNSYGGADIFIKATENYSSSNKGSKIEFYSTKNGENTEKLRLTIDQDGAIVIGSIKATEQLELGGAIKIASSNPVSIIIKNNDTSPIPKGGEGTMIYQNGHFFGWNGTRWKQLD
jgi:hypothetical protein